MTMRTVVFLLAFAPLACGHARHVETVSEPSPGVAPPHDPGTVPRAASPAGASPERSAKADGKEAPPLPMSPTGLLKPGALRQMQERLVERDYLKEHERSGKLDARTREALRDFQRHEGLPATGVPDDLTLQKLGLDVREAVRPAPSAQ